MAKDDKADKAKDDKSKALELAMSQIEKAFGREAIMKLGEKSAKQKIEVIPTGSLSLDIALGVGGLPRGRIIEIFGPEASGKTTLSLHVLAQAQKSGVAWVDALSTSVRPVITYWFMALYCGAKISGFAAAVNGGAVWSVAFSYAWTPADMALWAGILNFWFLGRVFDRVR